MHKALLLLNRIPVGRVTTYKILAGMCSTSPRAIGMVMKCNKDPMRYKCYKVVASDGGIRGYSGRGGVKGKIRLLKNDGIRVVSGRVDKIYFHRFT